MSGIGNRAAILTLSRIANYGLMMVSPIILVRLLSVEQFGHYREFLLYVSVLQAIALFSINHSLLYCIPAQPQCRWRTVRQTAILIAGSSLLVVGLTAALDRATGGRLIGPLLLPVCAFTLLSTNLDFWDYYWVATERPALVMAYSCVRLAARVVVATVVAAVTHKVVPIIWALAILEGIRLAGAGVGMLLADQSAREPPLPEPWREQVRYCLPSGIAWILSTFNRSIGGMAVVKVLGAAPLAEYSIGKYGEPIVVTLRNSVSGVLLPEMVKRGRGSREAAINLWQRATVVNAMMLFPVVVIVDRYARELVGTVFGRGYLGAAIVLQIYMVIVIREVFDFAPVLRSLNRNRPLVESSVASLVVVGFLLVPLVPAAGIAGAMIATAIGTLVDAGWLAYRTCGAYQVRLARLIPWAGVGKTAAAALTAGVILLPAGWTQLLGFGGVVLASIAYLGAFALLLIAMRVPEAYELLGWLRRILPARAAATSRRT